MFSFNYLFNLLLRHSRGCAALCVMLLVFGSGVASAGQSQRISLKDRAPLAIEVKTAFDRGPIRGHTALSVTIRNDLTRESSWDLRVEASDGYYRSQSVFVTEARFTVPAGQEQTFTLSVPLPMTDSTKGRHRYNSMQLEGSFTGPYTEYSQFSFDLLSGGNREGCFILLSPELYRKYGNELTAAYNKKSKSSSGSEAPEMSGYDRELLPNDWRCYVGFDLMVMTRADWQALPTGARAAILDAVATGQLQLRFHLPGFTPQVAKEMGIPERERVWRHGLGVVARYDDPLLESVDLPEKIFDFSRPRLPRAALVRSFYTPTKKDVHEQMLSFLIPDKSPPVLLLSLLMLCFAILIGPVSFFVIANGRKRLRLFITTPIFAGIVSVLLLLGIVFLDGIGGQGFVARMIYLDPDARALYVEQEEYVDTGLFFNDRFEVDGTAWLTPRGISISNVHHLQNEGTFIKQGDVHSGDWFASKRIQALNLRTYIASRETIDRLPNAEGSDAPVLFSNFRGECDVLYFVDADSQVWKGTHLKLGASQTLQAVDAKEFTIWLGSQAQRSGDDLGDTIRSMGIQRDHFYASVSHWQQGDLVHIGDVDWRVHLQLLVGQFRQKDQTGGVE